MLFTPTVQQQQYELYRMYYLTSHHRAIKIIFTTKPNNFITINVTYSTAKVVIAPVYRASQKVPGSPPRVFCRFIRNGWYLT